jgi:hypothetical protein
MINIKGCKINARELAIGRKIEMEHTNNPRVAEKIAKAHLCEFNHYYTKGLQPMEKKLLAQMKGGKK